jgi:hypothetical protein
VKNGQAAEAGTGAAPKVARDRKNVAVQQQRMGKTKARPSNKCGQIAFTQRQTLPQTQDLVPPTAPTALAASHTPAGLTGSSSMLYKQSF